MVVYNCPKTVKNPLQLSFPVVKPIEGNLSQNLFIGISAEAMIGVFPDEGFTAKASAGPGPITVWDVEILS